MLAWALDERPSSFDPVYAGSASEQLVSRQIYEPLVAELSRPFGEARRTPGLALSASPSRDATVWRLVLRAGVMFQDGARFNGSAVLANVDRWRDSGLELGLPTGLLVDAPRPDLVRFILPEPDRRFDLALSSPRLAIVSPRALARAVGGELRPDRAAAAGSGPFELRERSADYLLLARNTEWWGTRRGLGPALDQIRFDLVSDAAESLALLKGGAVQVASGLARKQLASVRRDPLLEQIGSAAPLAIERSVRGIDASRPAPALNSAWLTTIAAGG